MKSALNLLFWGLLLTMIRIEFGIDLLPEPIGYFLITLGCFDIQRNIQQAKKAGILASMMIFISIPTILIDVNKVTNGPWQVYGHVLTVLHLILLFFIFSFLIEVTKGMNNMNIQNRTQSVFSFYMIIHLLTLALLSFSVNLPENIFLPIITILYIVSFIMNIIFLVLIRTIRKHYPN